MCYCLLMPVSVCCTYKAIVLFLSCCQDTQMSNPGSCLEVLNTDTVAEFAKEDERWLDLPLYLWC